MATPVTKETRAGRGDKAVKKLLGRRRNSTASPLPNKKASPSPEDSSHATPSTKAISHTPKTVAEAQEMGELARMHDELSWAMDGLDSTSSSAREDSLASLLELLSSRRGRILVSKDGITEKLLDGLKVMEFDGNSMMALSVACLFLLFTMNGKIRIFTVDPYLEMMMRVMKFNEPHRLAESSLLAKAITKFLSDPVVCRFVPRETSSSPLSICLSCLTFSLQPREEYDATPIKKSLGRTNLLRVIVEAAMQESNALNDPRPTMKTVQGLWKLKNCLHILEYACFACSENERYLSTLTVEAGCEPFLSRMTLIQWFASQLKLLNQQKLPSEGMKKDCFRGILAVMMNTTESNEDGCQSLQESDGLDILCQCLQHLTHQIKGSDGNTNALRAWIDEISALLGVLINIVEAKPEALVRIKELPLQKSSHTQEETMLRIVIDLFVVSSEGEKPAEATDGDEITLDSLQHGEGKAMGSIVSVYSGILLAFLVVDDPTTYAHAISLLPYDSMTPVIVIIRKCLAFYKNVGALTPKTEQSLHDLIRKLESQVAT